jgi:hypothetical protein
MKFAVIFHLKLIVAQTLKNFYYRNETKNKFYDTTLDKISVWVQKKENNE